MGSTRGKRFRHISVLRKGPGIVMSSENVKKISLLKKDLDICVLRKGARISVLRKG